MTTDNTTNELPPLGAPPSPFTSDQTRQMMLDGVQQGLISPTAANQLLAREGHAPIKVSEKQQAAWRIEQLKNDSVWVERYLDGALEARELMRQLQEVANGPE